MTTLLGDLRQATINYLEQNVKVTISLPFRSDQLQPQQFGFTVEVKNTAEAAGGIGLVNVRYQVRLNPDTYPLPFLPWLIVPSGGSSKGAGGEKLTIGIGTDFFDFQPSDQNLAYLQMGESQSITFHGEARRNPNATFSLSAGIQADPDLNSIFPRNYTSARVKTLGAFPV